MGVQSPFGAITVQTVCVLGDITAGSFGRFLGKTSLTKNFQIKSGCWGGGILALSTCVSRPVFHR